MNNTWINLVPEGLVKTIKGRDGSEFLSLSVPYAESETGFASIALPLSCISQSKNSDGTDNTNMVNLFLGKSDAIRNFSVKKYGRYIKTPRTNAKIAEIFENDRRACIAAAIAGKCEENQTRSQLSERNV